MVPLPDLLVMRELELLEEVRSVRGGLGQGRQQDDEGSVVVLAAELLLQGALLRGLQRMTDRQHLPEDVVIPRHTLGFHVLHVFQQLLHPVVQHHHGVRQARGVLREVRIVARGSRRGGLCHMVDGDTLGLEGVDGVRHLVPIDLERPGIKVRRGVVHLDGQLLGLARALPFHLLHVHEQEERILVGTGLLHLLVQHLVGVLRAAAR
mmetsp:Transcript_53763/g.156258  ORF Transcript_53763/g.156258 Transcript_53763/m.156258 type:complete len:207 (-) Transcript_53763:358-978(-)